MVTRNTIKAIDHSQMEAAAINQMLSRAHRLCTCRPSSSEQSRARHSMQVETNSSCSAANSCPLFRAALIDVSKSSIVTWPFEFLIILQCNVLKDLIEVDSKGTILPSKSTTTS